MKLLNTQAQQTLSQDIDSLETKVAPNQDSQLDLSGVQRLSPKMAAHIVRLAKQVRISGGTLCISGIEESLLRVLESLRIHRIARLDAKSIHTAATDQKERLAA